MQHIADLLNSTAARRPRQDRAKIRRHSFARGREGVFWRSVRRQDVQKVVLAAKRYNLQTKAKGQRNGALGHIAIEILEYMANLIDYRTGRLEPSLDYLMEKLARSRDAIVRALRALRDHGFIDWIRRYVPTGAEGYGQPKYQQTSNAYRLLLPQKAIALLGRYAKPSPVSDDFDHAQAQADSEVEDMLSSLSREDRIRTEMGEDSRLAQALISMSLSLKNRGSAKQAESQSKSIYMKKMDGLTPDTR